MDPITLIVTALALGAAAGLKSDAEQVVKDAYAGLKSLLQRKYPAVDITPVEKKPDSQPKRASVAEDLAATGARDDQELLEQAKALVDAVEAHQPAAAKAIGVDLEEVKAEYLKIQKVRSEGTGVKVRKSEFTSGIDIGEIDAGDEASGPKAAGQ